MKLSNKELVSISKNLGEKSFINMTEENINMFQTIISELLELRTVIKTPKRASVRIPKDHVSLIDEGDLLDDTSEDIKCSE